MMSIGGAVAGAARFAMATNFDPTTFWDEVRRYGVTVASYTWTLLHDLVQAPPHPGERHHPVRLFIGSGMPRGLWRRVQERFMPARVLEFYASTEAGAVLVNLRGAKTGAMGRPLPGSAEVRIAAYDLRSGAARGSAGRLLLGADGFAIECGVDEIGMLLARVQPNELLSSTPLRGVFSREDAWLQTGDLFRRDADGDFWRIDNVAEVIRTADGPVFAGPIRDALGDLPAVDLVVAYGLAPNGAEHEIAVAAVTLRSGHELVARDIESALGGLPRSARPAIVQVVDAIPVTTWFRPITGPLREAGIPEPEEETKAWYRDRDRDDYRPLSGAARRRLVRLVA
jgi:putative long chain acyl-CoA synthase